MGLSRYCSQTEAAREAVKNLILDGVFHPGDLLPENQLAEYLKMSRTPVREALRRLQAEGVLESRKGQGTFLKMLTVSELKDIYEVRQALEDIALETSVYRISEEEIRSIRENFQDLYRKKQEEGTVDIPSFGRAEQKFHESLVQNSGNEYIRTLLEQIHLIVCQYDAILFQHPSLMEKKLSDYLYMAQSLLERDLEKLRGQLGIQLRWSLEQLLLHSDDKRCYFSVCGAR